MPNSKETLRVVREVSFAIYNYFQELTTNGKLLPETACTLTEGSKVGLVF